MRKVRLYSKNGEYTTVPVFEKIESFRYYFLRDITRFFLCSLLIELVVRIWEELHTILNIFKHLNKRQLTP